MNVTFATPTPHPGAADFGLEIVAAAIKALEERLRSRAATPSNGRPGPLFRAFDIAGRELEIGRQVPTLPPARDGESRPSNATASKALDARTADAARVECGSTRRP